jgi:hypothetical protein
MRITGRGIKEAIGSGQAKVVETPACGMDDGSGDSDTKTDAA